ncbi:hypothetical protein [Allorhodopirellula heiligendammensis]|nr:hypothetical protein [Allorhodopirellula heiligendammensis]
MRFFRCYLAIVLSMGGCVFAWTDARAQSQSTVGNQTQHVLLNNDQVLCGNVYRQGASVIVRRGNEAELTLRTAQVIAVADTLPELYQARIEAQRRRSSATLGERISDVRWCIDNGMPAHATEALMSVYAVAPNHPVAIQLEGRLRRLLEQPSPSETSMVAPAGFHSDPGSKHAVQNMGYAEAEAMSVVAPLDATPLVHASSAPAALHEFTSKIQPILLSRCSQCHHQQSGVTTNWNLDLPPGGAMRMTQRGSLANLNATRPLCNPAHPQQSKLYLHAITAHGGKPTAKPPIAEHEANLARTLANWIASLELESQQSEGVPAASHVAPASFATRVEPNFPPLNPINPADVATSLASPAPTPAMAGQQSDQGAVHDSANQVRPLRLPTVDNPNDVEQFNRETRLRRRLGLH